jgi:hypothetical protein
MSVTYAIRFAVVPEQRQHSASFVLFRGWA